MYGTLHPQGWRVRYTHAVVEVSYDCMWSLALWLSFFLFLKKFPLFYSDIVVIIILFIKQCVKLQLRVNQVIKETIHTITACTVVQAVV